jgi:hypothetical protein
VRISKQSEAFDQYVDGVVARTFEAERVETLYHYTSQQAFAAIIESRCFRSTHFEHMTADADELRHADALIDQVASEMAERFPTGIAAAAIRKFKARHDVDKISKARVDIWLACFCKDRDAPLLWQRFGHEGNGVCLGIACLDETYPLTDGFTTVLGPVEYDEHQRADLLRHTFYELLTEAARIGDGARIEIAVSGMLRTAAIANITFKHAKFTEEREWRMIVSQEERLATGPAEPRLDWPLRPNKQPIVIRSVDVGSKLGDDAMEFVREHLERLGYGEPGMPSMPDIVRSAVQ